MLRLARRPSPSSLRSLIRCSNYSTPSASKVPIKLVAELRKQVTVSLTKAREALAESNGSIEGALEWLQKDLVATGAAKAAKVSSRATNEGLISLSVLSHGGGLSTAGGVRAAMVELNCETDFVGRNEIFARLAMDVAHTAAFISEAKGQGQIRIADLPLEELYDAPLLSHTDPGSAPVGTVSTAIRDTIVKVGENISLRRARTVVEETTSPTPTAGTQSMLRLGTYVHGAMHSMSCGRVASLALLNLRSPNLAKLIHNESFRNNLGLLERSVVRQIVGFDTQSIKSRPENTSEDQTLYAQPFLMLAGQFNGLPVEEALKKWSIGEGLISKDEDGGVEVLDFAKWTVGEPTE